MLVPQAIRQAIRVRSSDRLFGVAPQDVLEGLHEGTVLIDEMQHAADVHLFEAIEKGMVDGLTASGIRRVQRTCEPRLVICEVLRCRPRQCAD